MIDKERWNISADRDKMEKSIKYNILVQYEKSIFFQKKNSSSVKQCIVFFSLSDYFLRI